ncbi:alpha/beta fold hydrolase [Pseudonocardia nigra]|uniref:alpha/beta fold hydrolase n=1 Tax=Pseudonocardia nigra TaxID=1921578 RepID=UPI001C5CF17B|nr:alpha/beta fold hydrolase [Pseudonocardia nigra]
MIEASRSTRLLAVLAATVAVTACATGDGPPVAAAPAPLAWGACPDGGAEIGMECASLDVPVDPDRPEGRRITLALGRLPASGPEPAEGSLLINFGGPGAPGIALLRERAHAAFAQLRERMDIVTWDPRGYGAIVGGRSTALHCDWTSMVRPRTPAFPADQAAFDALAAENREIATACRDTDPELFDHMDSAGNAADMEAIRQALGEPRLDYYGASYGGVFGQAYARLFPDTVGTMMFDGTGDHATADWDRTLEAIARSSDVQFQRFLDGCAADPGCALHGSDAGARWRQLVAAADREPVPALRAAGVRYTGTELQSLAMLQIRRGPEGWAGLAAAVVAAEQGDASGFAPPGRSPYPMVGTPGVTECLEYPRYRNGAHVAATVQRIRSVAPNTGVGHPLVAHGLTCVGWPAPVTNPPAPLPDGVPPLLGAGTWGDFDGTARVLAQVPGSVTIFHDGPGHVLYTSGNACVVEHANRYFLEGMLPPPGTTC